MADEDQNQENTAMREARQAAERQRKAARDAEKAAEEERQRREALEQQNSQLRQQVISGQLAAMGAPMGLAAHFPADREPTADNIEEFVRGTLGDEWTPRKEDERVNTPPAKDMSGWEQYDRTSPSTGAPPSRPNELAEVHQRMLRDNEAMTDLHARKGAVLTPDEVEKAQADARMINRFHAEEAAAIQKGQREPDVPSSGGFGGPFDPPRYALKIED